MRRRGKKGTEKKRKKRQAGKTRVTLEKKLKTQMKPKDRQKARTRRKRERKKRNHRKEVKLHKAGKSKNSRSVEKGLDRGPELSKGKKNSAPIICKVER